MSQLLFSFFAPGSLRSAERWIVATTPTASARAWLWTASQRSSRRCRRAVATCLLKERDRQRTRIERFFNKLKAFRRLATRYDKLAKTFCAALHFVAAFLIAKNS